MAGRRREGEDDGELERGRDGMGCWMKLLGKRGRESFVCEELVRGELTAYTVPIIIIILILP